MASDEQTPKNLADHLADPGAAKLLTELLESYGKLAKETGSAAPIIEALSASFALMSDSGARSEYDDLRRLLVQYLGSLDEGDTSSSETKSDAPFEKSPDVSQEEINAFAQRLLERGSKKE